MIVLSGEKKVQRALAIYSGVSRENTGQQLSCWVWFAFFVLCCVMLCCAVRVWCTAGKSCCDLLCVVVVFRVLRKFEISVSERCCVHFKPQF